MEHINWYPGHMKKTRELIAKNLKLVDAVVEVCDARIPVSSRNPIIDELVAGKERVLVLNKSDLADEQATKAWLDHYRGAAMVGLRTVLALNSMKEQSAHALLKRLEKIEADMNAKRAQNADRESTAAPRRRKPLRIMVVGIPNSGKSSLINRLAGRKSAATGDRPGVTRGKQWLALAGGMQLLDTPGILWPKFEDPGVGLRLAFCGSIRDEVMDTADLGLELIRLLLRDYPDMLAARFQTKGDGVNVSACLDGGDTDCALAVMERIAHVRGFLLPGKKIDYVRTAGTVLDEFRSGKIGRITLEHPDE
ncbi:MAG: ribosome biogenesis GTPase YlqF [Clostridiales Family XIII bacterium]|jgi:ribosome biogenesis GTPase A|nr:ribosome biogenesis GTPase YlqF [Clostridiales Family XIII bacterium]